MLAIRRLESCRIEFRKIRQKSYAIVKPVLGEELSDETLTMGLLNLPQTVLVKCNLCKYVSH